MAFLPMPPMIIPQIAAGAQAELDEIRDAARTATDWVCQAQSVALLVPGDAVGARNWSLDGFGIRVGQGTPVGLAEGIGRWLLDGRPATVVDPDADLSGYDGVLVMGDGSAARTEKAPKHLDPRAAAFDDAVVAILESGNSAALSALDTNLAGEVGCVGAPAWVGLARQVGSVRDARVDVQTDPFGVLYVVARWTVGWAIPA